MSIFVLNSSDNSEKLSKYIEICKSSSMTKGRDLRHAHYELGKRMAVRIADNPDARSFAIVVLMRAGLLYGLGIADMIEELGNSVTVILYDGGTLSEENLYLVKGKDILIVDGVVNTGKSIVELITQLPNDASIKVATTVIPNKPLSLPDQVSLYTIRTSDHQYTGAKVTVISGGKGPDTGDRLFNTM